jgi:hypothetical protein
VHRRWRRDAAAIGSLIKLARAVYQESPRRISPMLYTADDRGVVIPLTLTADHPLQAALRTNRYQLLVSEYAAQTDALTQELATRDEDVFVAKYWVRSLFGRLASYCTWGEEVASLLPVTDIVVSRATCPTGKRPGRSSAQLGRRRARRRFLAAGARPRTAPDAHGPLAVARDTRCVAEARASFVKRKNPDYGSCPSSATKPRQSASAKSAPTMILAHAPGMRQPDATAARPRRSDRRQHDRWRGGLTLPMVPPAVLADCRPLLRPRRALPPPALVPAEAAHPSFTRTAEVREALRMPTNFRFGSERCQH